MSVQVIGWSGAGAVRVTVGHRVFVVTADALRDLVNDGTFVLEEWSQRLDRAVKVGE